jgi:hypothetical protein
MDEAPDSLAEQRSFDLGPRSAWLWLTLGGALLAVAEAVALVAITSAVLPDPAAYILDLALVLPTIAVVIALASALTGRITLDPEQFRLRFGLLGGIRVPRADILQAELYAPAQSWPIGLGISLSAGSGPVTVWRGGPVPYVRIILSRPAVVRTAIFRRSPVRELVMGTESSDELVAALN